MRFHTLSFLLMLSCVCLALAQGTYDDCCLKYVKSMSKKAERFVAEYKHQKTDGGCNIPAVILVMKRGRRFCADPNDSWVKVIQKRIDDEAPKTFKKLMRKHSNRG